MAFIDVSGYQFNTTSGGGHNGVVLRPGALAPDYTKAVSAGLSGVFQRIAIGSTQDQSFDLGYGAAKSAHLAIGAYYVFQDGATGPTEAVALVSEHLKSHNYVLDLPVMLDLEFFPKPANPTGVHEWATAFLTGASSIAGTSLLYANPSTATAAEIGAPMTQWATSQARYPYFANNVCTKVPPAALSEWAGFIPWEDAPKTSDLLSAWSAWQFAPCGVWEAYGKPSDSTDDSVDVNVVKAETWQQWLAAASK